MHNVLHLPLMMSAQQEAAKWISLDYQISVKE